MELRVHKVRQMSSGGSYVAIYEADVEFNQSDMRVNVEILGTHPPTANPADVVAVREAIRQGAEWVLQPRRLGAAIRVRRVVIHPVDFKSHRYEMLTSQELLRMLGDQA